MARHPAPVPVRFMIGARVLLAPIRQLLTVPVGLPELIAGAPLHLPELPDDSEGYRVLSAPVMAGATQPGQVLGGRQHFLRHYIDLSGSFDAYMARFSGKTRATLRRKTRRLAADGSDTPDIREYRTPAEIAAFLTLARPLSRLTYQARLLDAGLPEGPDADAGLMALASADRLRAYLLCLAGQPAAYLCLPVEQDTVAYAYVGHDPAHASLSPGTVLQLAALERLFAEQRYGYFDFTEGDGAHKAMFATGAVDACSFLLLRATPANRLLLGALDAFDSTVARARYLAERTGALAALRRMMRG